MTSLPETNRPSRSYGSQRIRGLAAEAFCLVVLAACASLSTHFASSIVALGVFVGYMMLIFFRQPSFYLKYLPFLFAPATNIIGCAICEFSTFKLYELEATSGFEGSLPLLAFSRWLFVAILFALDCHLGVQTKMRPYRADGRSLLKEKIRFAAETATFALVALLFLHVIARPSFLEGLDRFEYNASYMTGIWSMLDAAVIYLVAFPVLAIRRNQRRALGIATIALLCLHLFWTGEKFGGFFAIACIFACAFYDRALSLSFRKTVITGAIMIFVSVALVGTALVANSFINKDNSANYYLPQRIAQQGQLWWKTFSQTHGQAHPEEFCSELKAIIDRKSSTKNNIGSDNGIYRIMYYTAPKSKVDRKLESGSRYTEAGYAVMYYYFGALGPVIYSCCMAALVFLIQNALVRALWTMDPLKMVIFPYFSYACRTGINMFVFHRFTSIAAILSYLYLTIDAIARKSNTPEAHNQTEQSIEELGAPTG